MAAIAGVAAAVLPPFAPGRDRRRFGAVRRMRQVIGRSHRDAVRS